MTLIKGIYSLTSFRGCSPNFQKLNFLHLFVALLYEVHFPKGIILELIEIFEFFFVYIY